MDYWALEDSQLRLEPGVVIDPDKPPQPSPEALARWVREVRGGIMAGAFYIERNLNIALECYFLGPLHAVGERSVDFGEALLAPLSFERRCNAALSVAGRICPDHVEELRAGLSEVRSIRNAMAHNPCWFEAEAGPDGLACRLRAHINKGKGAVRLSEDLVHTWNALIQRMIERTARLAGKAMDPQSDC